ncbi:MAG: hypothetical protein HYU86_00030 [Chloroflexi bacterium]|nr:hypothetical protein [Chloroflexota bacterium]
MKETRHDKRLAHLWAIFISLSLAAALTLTKGAVAAPEGGVSALVTATPITSVFRPTVTVTPVGGTVPLPQEVRGAVVDRQGRGVTGALVRVSSPGWYADTPSGGGGGFVFTLGKGEFSIQLTDRPSEPAFIVVTGDTRIYVEFREILLSEPTATPTPTPSATPTPHPTLTPESTPPPSPSSPLLPSPR